MGIDLSGRKVWGTEYQSDGRSYGDANWKQKMKEYVADQDFVIVEGRYGENNLDFHFNIKGFPFSLISKDKFLSILEKTTVGFTDDVYLYDAFENSKNIWSSTVRLTERNRYIFVSHTATECQLF